MERKSVYLALVAAHCARSPVAGGAAFRAMCEQYWELSETVCDVPVQKPERKPSKKE